VRPTTLFDKLWDAHVVRELGDGWSLLHIDRHLLHDLSGPSVLVELSRRGLAIHDPDAAFATPDHLISTAPDRATSMNAFGEQMWAAVRDAAMPSRIRLLDQGSGDQGIVHVVAPEQGIVLPGHSVVCGDSHTCTNGALGALAFGVGSSQGTQALATQSLQQHRPKQMRIRLSGDLGHRVSAKDVALTLISTLGASAGTGFAIEYAGPAVEAMDMEARLTLCNLTVELGAKFGVIAPDAITTTWLRGRRYAPVGEQLAEAEMAWSTLRTDVDARFDRDESIDVTSINPMVTWGTSPEHAVDITGSVPDVLLEPDAQRRESRSAALAYMGLEPGTRVAGIAIDWVFIGSCANSRLSDLERAAAIVDGGRVAPSVTAWVVPGSEAVKRDAEARGLDDVFRRAGFEWREPGCSMCVGANGDRVPAGKRCVSTSNRNFMNRQGPGARTHLASPETAAASALAGCLADPRVR
jgi:3-isopropylmalate/(R)-2-methylmalate dehydratase large subunit